MDFLEGNGQEYPFSFGSLGASALFKGVEFGRYTVGAQWELQAGIEFALWPAHP